MKDMPSVVATLCLKEIDLDIKLLCILKAHPMAYDDLAFLVDFAPGTIKNRIMALRRDGMVEGKSKSKFSLTRKGHLAVNKVLARIDEIYSLIINLP